jgi:BlaI family penicillinase repressor
MRVLWKIGEGSAGEIIAELRGATDWRPKTIQTLIRRLVRKGAVEFEQTGRDRVYRAAIDERACQLHASRSFLDRVFDGKLAPFLANFAGGGGNGLGADDLAELKKLFGEADDDDA